LCFIGDVNLLLDHCFELCHQSMYRKQTIFILNNILIGHFHLHGMNFLNYKVLTMKGLSL
jgi:hypothetical protein